GIRDFHVMEFRRVLFRSQDYYYQHQFEQRKPALRRLEIVRVLLTAIRHYIPPMPRSVTGSAKVLFPSWEEGLNWRLETVIIRARSEERRVGKESRCQRRQ